MPPLTPHHACPRPPPSPHRRAASHPGRRASKIVSTLCSCFSSSYVRGWARHFPHTPLAATPMFDARAVLYPALRTLRDYLSWRQADTHINNLVRLGGGGGGEGGAGGWPCDLRCPGRPAHRFPTSLSDP